MTARARITVRLASAEEAAAVQASLEPENRGFVRTRTEGAVLVAEAEAPGPGALLHTLDDLLASLSAAEKVLGSKD